MARGKFPRTLRLVRASEGRLQAEERRESRMQLVVRTIFATPPEGAPVLMPGAPPPES